MGKFAAGAGIRKSLTKGIPFPRKIIQFLNAGTSGDLAGHRTSGDQLCLVIWLVTRRPVTSQGMSVFMKFTRIYEMFVFVLPQTNRKSSGWDRISLVLSRCAFPFSRPSSSTISYFQARKTAQQQPSFAAPSNQSISMMT